MACAWAEDCTTLRCYSAGSPRGCHKGSSAGLDLLAFLNCVVFAAVGLFLDARVNKRSRSFYVQAAVVVVVAGFAALLTTFLNLKCWSRQVPVSHASDHAPTTRAWLIGMMEAWVIGWLCVVYMAIYAMFIVLTGVTLYSAASCAAGAGTVCCFCCTTAITFKRGKRRAQYLSELADMSELPDHWTKVGAAATEAHIISKFDHIKDDLGKRFVKGC